jgi:hypothetical protein
MCWRPRQAPAVSRCCSRSPPPAMTVTRSLRAPGLFDQDARRHGAGRQLVRLHCRRRRGRRLDRPGGLAQGQPELRALARKAERAEHEQLRDSAAVSWPVSPASRRATSPVARASQRDRSRRISLGLVRTRWSTMSSTVPCARVTSSASGRRPNVRSSAALASGSPSFANLPSRRRRRYEVIVGIVLHRRSWRCRWIPKTKAARARRRRHCRTWSYPAGAAA